MKSILDNSVTTRSISLDVALTFGSSFFRELLSLLIEFHCLCLQTPPMFWLVNSWRLTSWMDVICYSVSPQPSTRIKIVNSQKDRVNETLSIKELHEFLG